MNKNLLYLAFIAFYLTACSTKSTDPQPSNPVQGKHQLLSSVVTEANGGTTEIDYDYDNQNRMIGMHSKSINAPYADVADHVYTYDNDGNLIKSKITRGKDISIFDYIYKNGVPVLVKYSQPGNPSQGHTLDISVQNNQVIAHTITTPAGEHATVDFTYQNQNRISEVNKAYSPNNLLTFTLTFNDEYGTHNSPYLFSGSKWILPDVPYANKNELTRETINNDGSITIDTYQYTYNNQNYPVKAKLSSTYSGNNNSVITYTYVDAK
ncbi:hypothetical protein [Mucilaginibacter sp.]|uniref:hypothetical protein n=1 Tax=Mucilaginibacter sp. TaxID=1882438 RepID=UPI000CB1A9B8|nr:hypothetical protein [Mucilaginibacter sp.]PLW88990.1 MAG: hypothetical protein C0154_14000 [Mucilaginibacter sp.]PMP66135.1 MAG: hypothetical protein C0191_01660 [Mucilaginibacter sp.]HEK19650.1 hypothetical protein [Bacteroidota bacterium]